MPAPITTASRLPAPRPAAGSGATQPTKDALIRKELARIDARVAEIEAYKPALEARYRSTASAADASRAALVLSVGLSLPNLILYGNEAKRLKAEIDQLNVELKELRAEKRKTMTLLES
ncbi:MAG: hypothetical protein VKS61_06390 [Candidatus Sericytochromatia bacterium]|nr:hypothetical protein [Candidatus Sericytochromatia bacterium]